MEHSCAIDDDVDDSADDDWDSDPEDSAHEPSYPTPQVLSRPTSCFGNHWPLPAETVQQTKFGKPPHRLETALEAVKLERATSGSPLDHSMTDVADPISAYPYLTTSNGIGSKPPPVRTPTLHDYRSIPMSHQYSGESAMETFQSPTSLGSPDSYAQFSSQSGSIHSPGIYLHQPRYNTYPHPPRVHDIRLDDPLQVSQQQTTEVPPAISHFPNSSEPLSAHESQFSMDTTSPEDQLQNYMSPVSMPQAQYQQAQTNMIEHDRYQMPVTNCLGNFGPVPDWYANIKPAETYPGYDLPSDRVQGF